MQTDAHIHVCIHTSMHTYLHACMYTYMHAYIDTYMHSCIHTYIQYTHCYILRCIYPHTMHTSIYAWAHNKPLYKVDYKVFHVSHAILKSPIRHQS